MVGARSKIKFEFGAARRLTGAASSCEAANRDNGSETVNGVDTNLGSRKSAADGRAEAQLG